MKVFAALDHDVKHTGSCFWQIPPSTTVPSEWACCQVLILKIWKVAWFLSLQSNISFSCLMCEVESKLFFKSLCWYALLFFFGYVNCPVNIAHYSLLGNVGLLWRFQGIVIFLIFCFLCKYEAESERVVIFLNVLLFLVIVHLRTRTFPIGGQLIPPLHSVLKEINIKTIFIILNQTVKIPWLRYRLLYYVDTV